MKDGGDGRTAPATPSLLINYLSLIHGISSIGHMKKSPMLEADKEM